MHIRPLFTSPDATSLDLLHSLLDSALDLTCFDVMATEVCNYGDLMARVNRHDDDVILLDWPMAGPGTSQLVAEILARNPQLRVVVLLPSRYG